MQPHRVNATHPGKGRLFSKYGDGNEMLVEILAFLCISQYVNWTQQMYPIFKVRL